MTEIITRAYRADMQVEATGRTVVGIAAPFGVRTQVKDWEGEYEESFQRGAFAKTIAENGQRVKFLDRHRRDTDPLGTAVRLEESEEGLVAEMRVAKTARGDEVLELIRSGAVDGLSVGFNAVETDRKTTSGGRKHFVRTEVRLREISAVPFPAYEDAVISGVRGIDLSTVNLDELAAALAERHVAQAAPGAPVKTPQQDGLSSFERALVLRGIRRHESDRNASTQRGAAHPTERDR